MIVAGIDIGSRAAKTVILKDGADTLRHYS